METLTIDIMTAVLHVLFIPVMFFFAYLISVIFSELSKIKKQAIELKKEIEQTKFNVELLELEVRKPISSLNYTFFSNISLLTELFLLMKKNENSKK